MTDSERVIIDKLDKLDTIEEALKMLLVNDILKDAEAVTKIVHYNSEQQSTLQHDNEMLQKRRKDLESEIIKLQQQIESYKSRINTLQELVESKDRTIKAKEEYIQLLQGKTNNSTYSSQSFQTISKPVSYAKPTVKTYFVGEKVRIKSNCSYCYHTDEKRSKKQIPLTNPSSYICTIIERDSKTSKEQYLLYTKNAYGQEIRFWVDGDMIQSL